MSLLASVLVAIVALIHTVIAIVEIFFWNAHAVHGRLGYSDEDGRKVAAIVANAGIYNSFLAAGLVWGVFSVGNNNVIPYFFLVCVIVAGVFGAITLRRTTLIIQTLPAAIALLAVWLASTIK